ncbi:hypothetical protein IWX49DRAFT_143106 [Phyllosticta citricarpa]|uniref:Uncharacterized protein n=2 Tax=Phyllosticta TaxID=121621 RepID=A0ABR1N842_9PEZI
MIQWSPYGRGFSAQGGSIVLVECTRQGAFKRTSVVLHGSVVCLPPPRHSGRTIKISLCTAVSPQPNTLPPYTTMSAVSSSPDITANVTSASSSVAEMTVSVRASPNDPTLPTMPPEMRNRIWSFVQEEEYHLEDRIVMGCRRISPREETKLAEFKALFLRSNLRMTPGVRDEYVSLLWGSFKVIRFCSCSTLGMHTGDVSFLHFPQHPGMLSIEYFIHPRTLIKRASALDAIEAFVQSLAQMHFKGIINLKGIHHEVRLVQFGLRLLHEQLQKGMSINLALTTLECDPEWEQLSRLAWYPYQCRLHNENAVGIRLFASARDAASAGGMSLFEAHQVGRAAEEAYRRAHGKILVEDHGRPDGVMVESNSFHVSWDLSDKKAEGT